MTYIVHDQQSKVQSDRFKQIHGGFVQHSSYVVVTRPPSDRLSHQHNYTIM